MNDTDFLTWAADATAAIEHLGMVIRASFVSSTEAAGAFRPIQVDDDGQPKYDPFQARAMWERPCPAKIYREKRPYRMVQCNPNPVGRATRPKHGRNRR